LFDPDRVFIHCHTIIGKQVDVADESDAEELGKDAFDEDIVNEADLDTPALTDQEDQHTLMLLSDYVSGCLEEDHDSSQPGMLATKEAVESLVDRLVAYLHTNLDYMSRCHPSGTSPTISDQAAIWK
jgi:hypothetical protein